jgi:hypothetical protein
MGQPDSKILKISTMDWIKDLVFSQPIKLLFQMMNQLKLQIKELEL